MKYSIEITDYGCIETIELANGEKYQKRTQKTKKGYESAFDESFSWQIRKAGICEEIIEKVYEMYDRFAFLDFMELAELFIS